MTVLACAPISNGKAERMVWRRENRIGTLLYRDLRHLGKAIRRVLYYYCCAHRGSGWSLFELLYGVSPRMPLERTVGII